nr:immunoglobulin light chain junction region [Macaca mulatta]MOW29399.1 immunoglobulin light chain junction region [Macaca mulatta]MOW30486.1 immunoglobulin light chain junction region [Macaca mulatta]
DYYCSSYTDSSSWVF